MGSKREQSGSSVVICRSDFKAKDGKEIVLGEKVSIFVEIMGEDYLAYLKSDSRRTARNFDERRPFHTRTMYHLRSGWLVLVLVLFVIYFWKNRNPGFFLSFYALKIASKL